MSVPIWVDLTKSYSTEFVLERKRVNFFKSLGVEELLMLIGSPIFGAKMAIYEENGLKVYEFVDGCHRSRALFELGVCACRVSRFGRTYPYPDSFKGKISNIPVLSDKGYDFFIDMTQFGFDMYEFIEQQDKWPKEFNPFLFEFHNKRYDL